MKRGSSWRLGAWCTLGAASAMGSTSCILIDSLDDVRVGAAGGDATSTGGTLASTGTDAPGSGGGGGGGGGDGSGAAGAGGPTTSSSEVGSTGAGGGVGGGSDIAPNLVKALPLGSPSEPCTTVVTGLARIGSRTVAVGVTFSDDPAECTFRDGYTIPVADIFHPAQWVAVFDSEGVLDLIDLGGAEYPQELSPLDDELPPPKLHSLASGAIALTYQSTVGGDRSLHLQRVEPGGGIVHLAEVNVGAGWLLQPSVYESSNDGITLVGTMSTDSATIAAVGGSGDTLTGNGTSQSFRVALGATGTYISAAIDPPDAYLAAAALAGGVPALLAEKGALVPAGACPVEGGRALLRTTTDFASCTAVAQTFSGFSYLNYPYSMLLGSDGQRFAAAVGEADGIFFGAGTNGSTEDIARHLLSSGGGDLYALALAMTGGRLVVGGTFSTDLTLDVPARSWASTSQRDGFALVAEADDDGIHRLGFLQFTAAISATVGGVALDGDVLVVAGSYDGASAELDLPTPAAFAHPSFLAIYENTP